MYIVFLVMHICRNMVVNLACSKTQKTPILKFDNEAAKNQYVRMYICIRKCMYQHNYICRYTVQLHLNLKHACG